MSRRWVIAAAVVVVFLGGSVIASRLFTSEERSRGQVVAKTEGTGQARDGRGDEISSANGDQSEQGARDAGIAYASASQDWLYLSDEEIERSVGAVATQASAPSLSGEAVAELGAARDELSKSPGRVWWLVRPLASKVEHHDAERARVVVWTMTLLSAADVAVPQADWARVAVDLEWESGTWRVAAITDTPGPTPTVGSGDRPWDAEPFDEALAGFERIGSPVP